MKYLPCCFIITLIIPGGISAIGKLQELVLYKDNLWEIM